VDKEGTEIVSLIQHGEVQDEGLRLGPGDSLRRAASSAILQSLR
jgi:hypothetical protein